MSVNDPFIAVTQPYSFFENAVNEGIRESGLARKIYEESSLKLLRDYLTVLMGAFIVQDAMYGRYENQRKMFARRSGDYYYGTVLKRIQEGDVSLFNGLFLSAAYKKEAEQTASYAYNDAAKLIRKQYKEHRFLEFLSESTPDLMDTLSYTAVALRLRQKPARNSSKIYLSGVEKHFGRS